MVNPVIAGLLVEAKEYRNIYRDCEVFLDRIGTSLGEKEAVVERRKEAVCGLYRVWSRLQIQLDAYRTMQNAPKFAVLNSLTLSHGVGTMDRAFQLVELITRGGEGKW